MRVLRAWILVSLVFFAGASPAQNETRVTWAGMYMGPKKMGYTKLTVSSSTFKGKPVTAVKSYTRVELEVLGNSVGQTIESTTYTGSTGALVQQYFKISSGFADTEVTADYAGDKIHCRLTSDESPTVKTITVPKGARVVSDSSSGGLMSKLAGEGANFYYLNPLTLALEPLKVKFLGKETVRLGGKSYTALKVLSTTPMGTFTSWETESGGLLKAEMPLGMMMVREEQAAAQNLGGSPPDFQVMAGTLATRREPAPTESGDPSESAAPGYTPPTDFALATALAVDKPIENPRDVKALSMKVIGISEKSLAISDARQRAIAIPDEPGTYFFTIKAESAEPESAVLLPISEPSLQPFLQAAPYLEINDPAIKEAAARIRGDEKNSYKVAKSIRKWVFDSMKPDYTIGVPRSCADVLRRPRGVCRDYATLFAGVARAAGIPTRMAGGILYAQGKFFYHAWVECWVGKWVPFDATLDKDFVDATHVKFSEGDVTDMFNVARIVGRIKLSEVLAN